MDKEQCLTFFLTQLTIERIDKIDGTREDIRKKRTLRIKNNLRTI
jgi:hypothetical protein